MDLTLSSFDQIFHLLQNFDQLIDFCSCTLYS